MLRFWINSNTRDYVVFDGDPVFNRQILFEKHYVKWDTMDIEAEGGYYLVNDSGQTLITLEQFSNLKGFVPIKWQKIKKIIGYENYKSYEKESFVWRKTFNHYKKPIEYDEY